MINYNIIDNGHEYKIGIKLDKDYSKGEWINLLVFKKHIKKNYIDEFDDLSIYEKY